MDEFKYPDIGNMNYVSKNVISLWQKIIRHGGQPIEIDTNRNMDYNYHKFNLLGYSNSLTGILESIIGKIEMSEKHLTKVKSSRLGNKSQAIILYNII